MEMEPRERNAMDQILLVFGRSAPLLRPHRRCGTSKSGRVVVDIGLLESFHSLQVALLQFYCFKD